MRWVEILAEKHELGALWLSKPVDPLQKCMRDHFDMPDARQEARELEKQAERYCTSNPRNVRWWQKCCP